MKFDADGSRSLGFSTNVLPQAIATGCIHIGTITGKLNGVIPAHTPNGCRNEYASTSVETCSEYSPFSSCGMPQANSTTSMPPIQCSIVFTVFSFVSARAMSGWCGCRPVGVRHRRWPATGEYVVDAASGVGEGRSSGSPGESHEVRRQYDVWMVEQRMVLW